MSDDDAAIRKLVDTWMSATKAGDVDAVLDLMTDDAVFLVAGRPPMTREMFARTAREQSVAGAPTIDGQSEIAEIRVVGDWAFMWTRLTVVVTPQAGGPSITRAGYTMSVLERRDGRWLMARDANMLAPVG
jgi:uncharacterized protein (TIGR02246 family)